VGSRNFEATGGECTKEINSFCALRNINEASRAGEFFPNLRNILRKE
jgi:hypothetical protein